MSLLLLFGTIAKRGHRLGLPLGPALPAVRKRRRTLRDFVQLATGADLSGLTTSPGPVDGKQTRTP